MLLRSMQDFISEAAIVPASAATSTTATGFMPSLVGLFVHFST
jgi:hypothetical protein